MPELKKELNVIPISDAMAVSSNVEKRTLLLDQLKKNIFTNYKTILIAGTDSDSESVHYVAAAKMEVYRRRQNLVSVAKRAWEMNVDDPEKRKDYLQQMDAHIASGLLAEKEAAIYKKEYCEQIFEIQRQGKMTLSNEAYSSCLGYLVDLGQYEKAVSYIENISIIQRETISKVINSIENPSLAALVVGKIARASECNVRFTIKEGTSYKNDDITVPSEALVTITGNLIDNALDAMNMDSSNTDKELQFGAYTKDGELLIIVKEMVLK